MIMVYICLGETVQLTDCVLYNRPYGKPQVKYTRAD